MIRIIQYRGFEILVVPMDNAKDGDMFKVLLNGVQLFVAWSLEGAKFRINRGWPKK